MRFRIHSICLVLLLVVSLNQTVVNTVKVQDNVNLPSNNLEMIDNKLQEPTKSLEMIDNKLQEPTKRISNQLLQYMDDGTTPESFTGKVMVFSKSPTLGFDTIIPSVKLGSQYFHIIDNITPAKIRKLYINPSVTSILDDLPVDYTKSPDKSVSSSQPGFDSFQADDILNTQQVYDEFGYTGKGVKLGIVDSGVDFGITDLTDSAVLADSGYLASFDVTGTGIGITSITVSPEESQGDLYLPLEGETFDVFIGERGTIQTTDDLGIQLEDLKISGIPSTSVSNNYKVGIAYQGALTQALPSQYFIFVLADTQTAGVYDRIYVDMETSLAISLVQAGIILPSGRRYIELNEYDISNDAPFGPNNPIPAKDITGDGVNDVSMGGLAKVVDLAGVSGSSLIEGIEPDGNAIGMMFDPVGHGSLVASSAASDGNTSFPVYDNKNTAEVENATNYPLSGSAPDAKIVAHKAFSLADFVTGWLWTGGLELIENNDGNLEWVENENQRVDISSNSWGLGNVAASDSLKGFDQYSLLLDFLTTDDSLYEGYPGMIFVVSGGNGAPGWGTTATPGMASMAITVGSSTYFHYLNGSTGRNDVAWFSARGPSSYGTIKPDIVTPGHTGFVNVQVIQGYGNGTYAFGTFGGTSEAAPRATGVLALMVEAMRDQGQTPSLENLRLILKSTASDLGFHPAQQGAGLVNAYAAIDTIVNNKVIVSSTYSSQLAGERLNDAYFNEFDETHPLVTNPLPDPVTVLTPEQLENGVNIDISYLNGTSLPASQYQSSLQRIDLTGSDSFSVTTNKAQNVIALDQILPSSLADIDFMELSLTLNQTSWNAMLENGFNTPNITLFDPVSGDIVTDILSFNTYSQVLFAGNPSEDFIGTPSIRITDPGFVDGPPEWSGLTFQIKARVFGDHNWSTVTLTENSGNIALNAPSIPSEFQVSKINLTYENTTTTIPIVISPTHQAQFGDNIQPVGSSLDITQPYAQNQVTNTFDWGYRPESGDFNHYRISVPDNATFLAAFTQWELPNLIPNMYLFNSTGDLITKSDVEYIGGGFYENDISEPFQQNLLTEVTDDTYYLMIHTTNLPFEAGPFGIDVFFRYLDLEELPTPSPQYSQDINSNITGDLLIDASQYKIPQFPEFNIQTMNAQVYQGTNRSIRNIVENDELTEGPNTNYFSSNFDDVVRLNLTAGSKVDLSLKWEHSADADIYVYEESSFISQQTDLLKGTGTTPGTSFEKVKFAAENTGTYLVYIDYIGGLSIIQDFNYTLSYDTRKGPTIVSGGASLEIDSSIFPDNNYGVLITYLTNFDYIFESTINITTDNLDDFQFNVDTPSSGSTLRDNVEVSWTSSRPVTVDIILIINGNPIQVTNSIEGSSTSFDSTLYPNGEAILQVVATDQIYVHTIEIDVSLDNEVISSLPSIQTSEPRDLSIPLVILISVFVIPMFRRKSQ